MHVCTVVVRPLNLRHRVHHLDFERVVEPSLLLAKVTLDDNDGLRWKVKNLNPVYCVVFGPSQHDEFQNSLRGRGSV